MVVFFGQIEIFENKMNRVVKVLLLSAFLSNFDIETCASEKSISENFQNDKEMSLLYNKGECRFIKNENDLKLFALRESYKSHLYKIRHSGDMPAVVDYTNSLYAEIVYTKIPTALANFVLNSTQQKPALPDSLTANDINTLQLGEFVDNLKQAKLQKSPVEFLNKMENVSAKQQGYELFLDIFYYDNKETIKEPIKEYFYLSYENNAIIAQNIRYISGGYPDGWHGLINKNGTCYFNAAMHFLNASKDFRDFIEDVAKICRMKNIAPDNIFVTLHNIFNLINANISLVGEADIESEYSKKLFDKQFNKFMEIINLSPKQKYHPHILLSKMFETMLTTIDKDGKISDLKTVISNATSQFSILYEDVTRCNECGYDTEKQETVCQMMCPCTNEDTGAVSNEELNKCFHEETELKQLSFCPKCNQKRRAIKIHTKYPSKNLLIAPSYKRFPTVYKSAKLLKEVVVNPNNNDKYVLRATILLDIRDLQNADKNHFYSIIKCDEGYFVVDNNYVGKITKNYKEIISDTDGEGILLYEKIC